jgi:hypothetical protein
MIPVRSPNFSLAGVQTLVWQSGVQTLVWDWGVKSVAKSLIIFHPSFVPRGAPTPIGVEFE